MHFAASQRIPAQVESAPTGPAAWHVSVRKSISTIHKAILPSIIS